MTLLPPFYGRRVGSLNFSDVSYDKDHEIALGEEKSSFDRPRKEPVGWNLISDRS